MCIIVIDSITFVITANQLVGAYEGQQIKIECHSEAYPKSINYWTKEKGDIVPQGRINFIYLLAQRLPPLPVPVMDTGDTSGTVSRIQLYSHDQMHIQQLRSS